ncbi:heparan-alpha-glucosaminide N-acetyltransferase domain-containing protein [Pseudonocardia parietis]|uniref:Membrane protein n=1 Tax=Pseudonocardia parietis TaxID=570936 RepID=A0ABS4VUQ2_9PSEU|nr:heparan-alpha-glucosaminide N-acetyltransferase domain-containing protein [Pseudonocardia parietis]MBP2367269.1 putative membrane protein [Pseudonocardia parietis]
MSAPAPADSPPPAGTDVTTPLRLPTTRRRPRLVGVDVARGLAVIGMIATHALPQATENGSPTAVAMLAAGRAAATFVFVAGVSVAFLSGGPERARGRSRVAASAGLLVRAVIVLVLGLALGLIAPLSGIWGILPVYGLLFVLALPLLGAGPLVLGGITAAVFALGPLLLMTTAGADLPYAGEDDPTFSTIVQDPLGVLVQLLLSGAYPVVVYLGYLTAGMAVGRLDLSSRRVARWLLGGGLALAVASRAVSWFLLYPLGGLARLGQEGDDSTGPAQLLWEEHQPLSTWWHLALPAPHSHTPIDLLHTLGAAAAVLGAALLLTRSPRLRRLLAPLAAVGSLALTLYCAHLVLLATGALEDRPALLFATMLVGALALAVAWRRWIGQGPLEKLVSVPATAARSAVAARLPRTPAAHDLSARSRAGIRAAAGIAAVAVIVAALGLGVWTRTDTAGPTTGTGAAPVEGDVVDAPRSPAPAGPAPGDPVRYCVLSDRYDGLLDTEDEPTQAALEQAAATMDEMRRVAPAEIRGAVAVLADDARAEANATGGVTPDDSAVESAQTTVDTFDAGHCP